MLEGGRVDATNRLKVYPGGVVSVLGGEVHVGASGFRLEGGTIDGAGEIVMTGGGNIHNDGVVSPVPAADPLTITGGNYYQDPGGGLEVKIGGTDPSEYSQLEVAAGAAFLNGFLDVELVDLHGHGEFAPTAGDEFEILGATGGLDETEFAIPVLPALSDLAWHIDYGANIVKLQVLAAFLEADFDEDGDVDGDDFLAWQGGFGISNGAGHGQGDANADGDVDRDDYLVWQNQFGEASVVGASEAVPEPGAAIHFLSATLLALAFFRAEQHSL